MWVTIDWWPLKRTVVFERCNWEFEKRKSIILEWKLGIIREIANFQRTTGQIVRRIK